MIQKNGLIRDIQDYPRNNFILGTLQITLIGLSKWSLLWRQYGNSA
ncbi:MAG: hypothetical protein ACJA1A_002369 [Saprospiraceae bacterium]|jgi:hypothetical protein